MHFCLGSGGSNNLNNAASGGPSPAGGAADNVSVSNPFDDVSTNPQPRSGVGGGAGGPFAAAGAHPPYPSGSTPPRPPTGQNYAGQPGGGGYQYPPGPAPGPAAPPDQYSPYSANSGYPPGVRPVYPPYSGDSGPPPPPSPSNQQGPPATPPQDPYNRYPAAPPPGATYQPRPTYGGTPPNTGASTSQPPAGPGPVPGPGPGPYQDYVYRPDQVKICGVLF